MIEMNKITRAEFLIYKYVEDLLLEIRVLNSQNLDEYVNLPAHGLDKNELIALLQQLFESGNLVAHKKDKGYFSPTLNEIEKALDESAEFSQRSKNTFYGYVSIAFERYLELEKNWGSELIRNDEKES